MFKSWKKLFALLSILSVAIIVAQASHASPSAPTAPTAQGDIIRISEPTAELDDNSTQVDISDNGRYITFRSDATNVVGGISNGTHDIFVRDTETGTTTRVSVATDGTEADDASSRPVISANGRFIAFESDATNLVSGDSNGKSDIFVHDRQAGTTVRVSVATNGAEANQSVYKASISDNGRYVTFHSLANTLVSGDVNGQDDVFMRDTQTNTTSRVSVVTGGAAGNGGSGFAVISDDGQAVAFQSDATNLVSGDTNGVTDIFLHDIQNNITSRVSVATGNAEGNGYSFDPAISADGQRVVFQSYSDNLVGGDVNGTGDIFLYDSQSGTTTHVSRSTGGAGGNADHHTPAISANGRYIAFSSAATNLVSGDTNGEKDIFLRDTQDNTTIRVSTATAGTEGDNDALSPALSENGRYVAFVSYATNIVNWDDNGKADVFVHDTQTAVTDRVSLAASGIGGDGNSGLEQALSADGRYVAFQSYATNLVSGDTNFSADIFVRDAHTGVVKIVSVASDGTYGNISSYDHPDISADGRYVAFASRAYNLVSGDTNGKKDVFVHDMQTGDTIRLSITTGGAEGDGDSANPSISADGRYVAFESYAANLVSGDTNGKRDVFLHDIQTGITSRLSTTTSGTEGNDYSETPAISDDGKYVAFMSAATNLVSADNNGDADIFVRDIQLGITSRVSIGSGSVEANAVSFRPDISANGRYVAFESAASNLVNGDTNGVYDIFVHDTQLVTTRRISLAAGGGETNGASGYAAVSDDGRYVAFRSAATNLVSGDTNGVYDVFVYDTMTEFTTLASRATSGGAGNGYSQYPAISGNGRFVAFRSSATDLIDGDVNEKTDIFRYERNDVSMVYLPMIVR